MTAADTKGGDDVSVEVAATGPPGDAASSEPTKEPKCGGSGGDKREYVRRRSSVQQLAHAAWREAAGISAAVATGLSISVGGLLIGLVEVIPPVAVSGLRCVCSVLYLLPVIALWRPQLLAEKGHRLGLAAVSVVLALRALTFTLGSSALPLAEFSLLINTMPVFAAIFAVYTQRQLRPHVLAAVSAAACFARIEKFGVDYLNVHQREMKRYHDTKNANT